MCTEAKRSLKARPLLEVADILRGHANGFFSVRRESMSSHKRRVATRIETCRTPRLGGHKHSCNECDHAEISYNSCRDRHCPKCQGTASNAWLNARQADLLPVEYFHVVFTVPTGIAEIALQNKRAMYGILMRTTMETLKQIAADPKHLGAQIGALAILHTWGQSMMHHPHVHCVVPGGGLSSEGDKWISCRPGFFLPVKVLSEVFRGKFINMTRQAFANGELSFYGDLEQLNDAKAFASHLAKTYATNWVVYAKPPFGGPDQVLKYLARYSHRVAISNHRLVSMDKGRVKFRWKNYAKGNRHRTMELDAHEFIRRFLTHVFPKGFMRIRHCGFLANACRAKQIPRCRELLDCATPNTIDDGKGESSLLVEEKTRHCPSCKTGKLIRQLLPVAPVLPCDLANRPKAKPPPSLINTT